MPDLDLSRYEGHAPEPWHCARQGTHYTVRAADRFLLSLLCDEEADHVPATSRLLGDAPRLLAEVKRLREELAGALNSLATAQERKVSDFSRAVAGLNEERDALAEALRLALRCAMWTGEDKFDGDWAADMERAEAALASAGRTSDGR